MSSEVALLRIAPDVSVMVRQVGDSVVFDASSEAVLRARGLQSGARVLSVGGALVARLQDLIAGIVAVPAGSEVTLSVRGTNGPQIFRFERQPPATSGGASAANAGSSIPGGWTSAASQDTVDLNLGGANIRENSEGLPEVTHRVSHAAAATVPLRAKDVIVEINGHKVNSAAGFRTRVEATAVGTTLRLRINRAGEILDLGFPRPAP